MRVYDGYQMIEERLFDDGNPNMAESASGGWVLPTSDHQNLKKFFQKTINIGVITNGY